jgi:hypothetical protein
MPCHLRSGKWAITFRSLAQMTLEARRYRGVWPKQAMEATQRRLALATSGRLTRPEDDAQLADSTRGEALGELVRPVRETSGEVRRKPNLEVTLLQGEVVSRTAPTTFWSVGAAHTERRPEPRVGEYALAAASR